MGSKVNSKNFQNSAPPLFLSPFLVLSICIQQLFYFSPAPFFYPYFYQPHYLKLSDVVPKFFFFPFLNPLRSNIKYTHFFVFVTFFVCVLLFVSSLLCSPLCFFPDPTFFVHLPFSLSFFHFRCLGFLHPIFFPLLKNR
jgi:hypothetical protein